jgi:hypothetical protein
VNLNLNLKVKNTFKINSDNIKDLSEAYKQIKQLNFKQRTSAAVVNNSSAIIKNIKASCISKQHHTSNEKRVNRSNSKKDSVINKTESNNNITVVNKAATAGANKCTIDITKKSLKGTISDISKSRNVSKNKNLESISISKPCGIVKSNRLTFVEKKKEASDVNLKIIQNDTKSRNRAGESDISKSNTTTDNKSMRKTDNNFLLFKHDTAANCRVKIKEITKVKKEEKVIAIGRGKLTTSSKPKFEIGLSSSKTSKCKIKIIF